MKVLINRLPVRDKSWGGGAWFVNAMYDHASMFGHETLSISDVHAGKWPDIILIVGLDADDMGLSAHAAINYSRIMMVRNGIKVSTVLRVNECDARKATTNVDGQWRSMSQLVDGTIFVSKWLQQYHSNWFCSNNSVIHNGVSDTIFHPSSKTRNSDKLKLVTHHWSNNQLKGFDVYEKLDAYIGVHSNIEFTYIGRDRGTFKNTNLVAPLHGVALGNELNKHDVYISASRFDPGPNHVIEALSCELPTFVHPDGGGAVEFAGIDHTFLSIDDLIVKAQNEKIFNQQKPGSWLDCVKEYFDFLETTWKTNIASQQ